MPDKHPILIFNDIKFEQLKALVAFIYNGSVNVSENNIHAFLNAAQSLLIKGLSEGTSNFFFCTDGCFLGSWLTSSYFQKQKKRIEAWKT